MRGGEIGVDVVEFAFVAPGLCFELEELPWRAICVVPQACRFGDATFFSLCVQVRTHLTSRCQPSASSQYIVALGPGMVGSGRYLFGCQSRSPFCVVQKVFVPRPLEERPSAEKHV